MNSLVIKNVEHRYSGNPFRLGPIDLKLEPGSCIGLMGENGAGKSTLFQIITGNLTPAVGSIIFGDKPVTFDAYELKKRFGYLPQNLELPQWVSATEILRYACCLYNLDSHTELIAKTIEHWAISEYADKPIAACSHGMKKRVALGLASIHDPDLLILDEPFSGLDLYHIKALQDLIMQRQNNSQITILSTHIAPYSAKLCRQILSLKSGQIEKLENWAELDYLKRIAAIEQLFYK